MSGRKPIESRAPQTRLKAGAVAIAAIIVGLVLPPALAQDPATKNTEATEASEKSRVQRFLESKLSAPGRTVEIGEIDGLLSSSIKVARIAVSDEAGLWLELKDLSVDWNRLALARWRVSIDSLQAAEIRFLRKPVPSPSAEKSESDGEDGGGLPVSIIVRSFELPAIFISADAAGTDALLSASGAVTLTKKEMSARFDATRLDGAGGKLAAEFGFDPEPSILIAKALLSEPAGGLAATALKLPGAPALALSLDGEGPIDDWQAELSLTANERPVMSGTAAIRRNGDTYRGVADIAAQLGELLPSQYAFLAGGDSRIQLAGARADSGEVSIERFDYSSAQIQASVAGRFSADYFPVDGQVSVTLDGGGASVSLPASNGMSLAGLAIDASLGGNDPAIWEIRLGVDGLATPAGAIGRVEVTAGGRANALADAKQRSGTFDLKVIGQQLALKDPRLSQLAGSELALVATGTMAARSGASIEQSRFDMAGLTAQYSGSVTRRGADGTFQLSANDLAGFGLLTGRELGGALALNATGSVSFDGNQIELSLDGQSDNARVGVDAADRLLAGLVTFKGGARRNANGLTLEEISVAGAGFSAQIDGTVDEAIDLSAAGTIADIGQLSDSSTGPIGFTARVTGPSTAPDLDFELMSDKITLSGKPVSDLLVGFSGQLAGEGTSGAATLRANLDSLPVTGGATLHNDAGGARRIEDLSIRTGENAITGALALDAQSRINGDLVIDAPDLATLAPLFLTEATGMLKGSVRLSAEAGRQSAVLDIQAREVGTGSLRIGAADIALTVSDLFGAPGIEGTLAGRSISAGDIILERVEGKASQSSGVSQFEVSAHGPDTDADIAGSVRPANGGMTVALDNARVAHIGADLRLSDPASIQIRDGGVRLDGLTLSAGGGRIDFAGTAGSQLDLAMRISNLPASLANGIAPDLGAAGTVSGTVDITGASSAPVIKFNSDLTGASVAAMRSAGLPALNIASAGTFANSILQIDADVGGAPGLALDVGGTVALGGEGALNLSINGAAPLGLAQAALASRGASLSGAANLALKVGGSPSTPAISGSVTGSGGRLADPGTGVVLSDLAFDLGLDGDKLAIRKLTARAGSVGALTVTGSAGISAGSGYPLDISAQMRDGIYTDGDLVKTQFDADLTVSGPALNGPRISGTIRLDRTDITVPSRFSVGAANIEVEHRNASAAVKKTLNLALPRARPRNTSAKSTGTAAASTGAPIVDITIDTPARIFVRGRGLDAELGGQITLQGTPGKLSAVGAFELRRGRLDILSQRIKLTRGNIVFEGDLDPILDFAGTSSNNGYDITVTVAGRASDPKIEISSSPTLPDDEVLAQFLYGRSIDELSPIQLVQLAAAAAELGGLTSGPGLLGRLRQTTGLDGLDVVTDAEGNAAVRAGRYVSDNIYFGVEQGSGPASSRVTIDLDISDNIKARGAVGANGDSSIGLFFEKEY